MSSLMEKYPFLLQLRDVATPVSLADPQAPDCPLIFANARFEALTGYKEADIRGRNCRFLQTGDENDAARLEMRTAIEARRSATVCLVNARKDGAPFLNYLCMDPLPLPEGETLMVGCQFRFGRATRSSDFAAHLERLEAALDLAPQTDVTRMLIEAMQMRRASVVDLVQDFLRRLRSEQRPAKLARQST